MTVTPLSLANFNILPSRCLLSGGQSSFTTPPCPLSRVSFLDSKPFPMYTIAFVVAIGLLSREIFVPAVTVYLPVLSRLMNVIKPSSVFHHQRIALAAPCGYRTFGICMAQICRTPKGASNFGRSQNKARIVDPVDFQTPRAHTMPAAPLL